MGHLSPGLPSYGGSYYQAHNYQPFGAASTGMLLAPAHLSSMSAGYGGAQFTMGYGDRGLGLQAQPPPPPPQQQQQQQQAAMPGLGYDPFGYYEQAGGGYGLQQQTLGQQQFMQQQHHHQGAPPNLQYPQQQQQQQRRGGPGNNGRHN